MSNTQVSQRNRMKKKTKHTSLFDFVSLKVKWLIISTNLYQLPGIIFTRTMNEGIRIWNRNPNFPRLRYLQDDLLIQSYIYFLYMAYADEKNNCFV